MRRTFAYLANIIIQNYKDEYRASRECWKCAENAQKNGNEIQTALFTDLGNTHARKADALLKIIMDEKLATPDAIFAIEGAILADVRNYME